VNGDFWVDVLRNDLLALRAVNGKVKLAPKERIQPRHREIVRKHQAAIVAALERLPNNQAHPRSLLSQPGRQDEVGHDRQAARPRVITRRKR
jgi:hypothetical protein